MIFGILLFLLGLIIQVTYGKHFISIISSYEYCGKQTNFERGTHDLYFNNCQRMLSKLVVYTLRYIWSAFC